MIAEVFLSWHHAELRLSGWAFFVIFLLIMVIGSRK
jgi:hypothetical protein